MKKLWNWLIGSHPCPVCGHQMFEDNNIRRCWPCIDRATSRLMRKT